MNLAAALGKIALVAPQSLAQDDNGQDLFILPQVIKQWSLSLRFLKEEPERAHAYK